MGDIEDGYAQYDRELAERATWLETVKQLTSDHREDCVCTGCLMVAESEC